MTTGMTPTTNGVCEASKNPPGTPLASVIEGACETRLVRLPWLAAMLMKPLTPSGPLSEVVGAKAMPRTEVTKKLWAYIKKNKLQDKTKRTMINADDKLRAVFGGKRQVSMFEMTKLVSKHLK